MAMAKTRKKARPVNPHFLRDLACDRVIVGRNPQVCRTCLGAGTLFNTPGEKHTCPACYGLSVEWNGSGGEQE